MTITLPAFALRKMAWFLVSVEIPTAEIIDLSGLNRGLIEHMADVWRHIG